MILTITKTEEGFEVIGNLDSGYDPGRPPVLGKIISVEPSI